MSEELKEDVALEQWLKSAAHLPTFMRDFHNQKDLIKFMHTIYRGDEFTRIAPTPVDGHIYIVDCFLWFMASRGYTLQKSKKTLTFRPLPTHAEVARLTSSLALGSKSTD